MNATGVTAGPAESNGKLLLGIWRDSLHVTCGLTACTPGSAQRSVTSMGKLYLFTGDAIDLLDCTITNITIIISLIRTNAA